MEVFWPGKEDLMYRSIWRILMYEVRFSANGISKFYTWNLKKKKAFSYLQLGMERKMCFQRENWLTILQIKCSALDELDEYNKLLFGNILSFI